MTRYNILTNSRARQQFVDGCLGLKREPLNGVTTYDYFVWWHHRAMTRMTPQMGTNPFGRNAAHGGPSFGPWHRLLLLVFEFQLRRVLGDNNFRIPYWDWGADAAAPLQSALWGADVMGGDGNPVTSGPFSGSGEFRVRLIQNGSSDNFTFVNRPLRRDIGTLTSRLPSTAQIREIIRNFAQWSTAPWNNGPSTGGFRKELEIPLHNVIHRFIGLDMMTSTSPNDPIFWLHHANIDRIWAAWQSRYGFTNYVPSDAEPATLDMHRRGDRMHSFLNQAVTVEMVLDYRSYYDYDSIADILP